MMDRRRALMMREKEEQNGWKPGTYNRGSSVVSVNNEGVFEITQIGASSSNRVYPQFKRPIKIVTGDALQVKFTKVAGTKTATFIVCYLGSNTLTSSSGESWKANSDSLTLNYTATVNDNSRNNMTLGTSASVLTGTNCKIKIEIYINGERVI